MKYVGDITYLLYDGGHLYLATVIDCYSRRLVGWSIAEHMRTELVQDALRAAQRERVSLAGAIVHHDHGAQYTSKDYATLCASADRSPNWPPQTMSARGRCQFARQRRVSYLPRRPCPRPDGGGEGFERPSGPPCRRFTHRRPVVETGTNHGKGTHHGSAITGHFVTGATAARYPSTTVTEQG